MSSKQKAIEADEDLELSIKLGMLTAVERSSDVTQRKLAQELGIALGLTNAYLKRLVKKGYIKATQAPANRYFYYLTPKGFAEKSALTATYLSQSFKFFRDARAQCAEAFVACQTDHMQRIVLCGTGDLAEIAVLSAQEFDVNLIAVVDPHFNGTTFLDLPVVNSVESAADLDGAIITDMRRPQETYEEMVARFGGRRIIALPLLGINTAIRRDAP